MLTLRENIRVGDFGLARDVLHSEFSMSDKGTIEYMPREALLDYGKTTKLSDVWGFGCVAFELAIAGQKNL